jgi:light-regulated signal transduction histidine kinase (bacteriophytochrome)
MNIFSALFEVKRNTNEDLEKRVEARTEAFRKSNKQMEAFSYSIVHDLRGPLRAMKGFSHALMEDYAAMVDKKGKEYLARISAAAEHMDQLIHDLLEYGRLNTVDLPIQVIETEEVLDYVLKHLDPDTDYLNADIIRRDKLPNVDAHKIVLKVVLTNLIGNALKFVTPAVRPRIEIRSERRADRVPALAVHLQRERISNRIRGTFYRGCRCVRLFSFRAAGTFSLGPVRS